MVKLILMRIPHDAGPGDEPRSEGRETFARCRAFISQNYMELGSTAEIARRCHLDRAYLARLFKSFGGGERPLQLLTRLKTQHAAGLILRHGFSVKGAGEAVEFNDPYHFSRVFKRIHGIAPGHIHGCDLLGKSADERLRSDGARPRG
ncbi:MAG: helix-turn-helix transcriptional regulator [Kiritimatiellae bacterium]|nr:helix-turn-helix transcriptional regulator [Kiritimatiellia bacterium]